MDPSKWVVGRSMAREQLSLFITLNFNMLNSAMVMATLYVVDRFLNLSALRTCVCLKLEVVKVEFSSGAKRFSVHVELFIIGSKNQNYNLSIVLEALYQELILTSWLLEASSQHPSAQPRIVLLRLFQS